MTLKQKRRIPQNSYNSSPISLCTGIFLFAFFLYFSPSLYAESNAPAPAAKKSYTIMFYLNGDNDLTYEVLYALDMLETVGSSNDINILALVDGRPGSQHTYGDSWDGAKLVYVTQDYRMGEINSIILQELDDEDLGSPETLELFIRRCLEFPADRYIFCTFAHGRGIIDTKTLAMPGPHKSLAISVDETSGTILTLPEFRNAIQDALEGKKFDAMVFFSCLTNMVEVGYELKDLTKYLIGSEDEIRIVNKPPGRFQIRGIKFEEPLKAIQNDPTISITDLGKIIVDTFIEQYKHGANVKDKNGNEYTCKYSATLSIVDCQTFEQLAVNLNNFSNYIINRLQDPKVAFSLLEEIRFALSKTQRYASFLNLEYYDAQDFFHHLYSKTRDNHLKRLCNHTIQFIKNVVVVYERHTDDCISRGISVYLSNFLIPENIYKSHQAMYRRSKFSRDTSWDEMIDTLRSQMRGYRNSHTTIR